MVVAILSNLLGDLIVGVERCVRVFLHDVCLNGFVIGAV